MKSPIAPALTLALIMISSGVLIQAAPAQVVDFQNPPKAPMRSGADPVAGDVEGPGVIRPGVEEKTGDPSTLPAAPVETTTAPTVVAPPKLPDEKHPAEMPAAMKLYNKGLYPQAQKMFEKFINTGVADEATHLNLAYCLYYQHKYTASLKQFDWVATNAKHNFSAKFKAGNTAMTLRKYMAGVCPGNCLKPNDPHWQVIPGLGGGKHYKFNTPGGGWKAFSEGHMGDVIVFKNGEPFDVGPCPSCGGRGSVAPLRDGDAPPQ